jgi:hypothetical protein
MATVNMQQGLKNAGDRVSGVSGNPVAVGAMGFDDRATGFAATDTAHNSGGAPTNFIGKALDSTPTGGAAASPYVVSHAATLATGDFNGSVVKRIGLHFKATAPTVSDTTLGFGIDGLSITKASTFALVTTFKLSYS